MMVQRRSDEERVSSMFPAASTLRNKKYSEMFPRLASW
jgi:hypothetical protein